jgi:tetratricopeptide (TPR) repeat protein
MMQVPAGTSASDSLTAAYRSLYLAFAGADRAAAIAEAVRFERATLESEPKKGFEKLSEADSRLFESLARTDPRALLALGMFYEDLAYRHYADRSWGLVLRANNATEAVLDRFASAASTREERTVAADAYQGFAADLLDHMASGRAEEMLEKALALEPGDVEANLALAILLQRDERYAPAALRLDRALQTDPANREARLRRALLSVRVSPEGKGVKELEALAAGAEGDWITVVATQERGRLLLAARRYERAIAWFGAAADRFPYEHSLRTALAFAQSREGRRNAAGISARNALKAPREAANSARRRFADSPVRLIAGSREATRVAAESRRETLRLALATVAPPEAATAGVAQ